MNCNLVKRRFYVLLHCRAEKSKGVNVDLGIKFKWQGTLETEGPFVRPMRGVLKRFLQNKCITTDSKISSCSLNN
jgi:hypothetical protein